jgi:hypothetical protein
MAAGDITAYDLWTQSNYDGDGDGNLSSTPVDCDTDTIKLVLLTSSYVPDNDETTIQHHFDDISANEVATGTAYTGPITLTSGSVSSTGGVMTLDYDDVVIAADAGGFTNARWFVIYKDSGTPATSPLMMTGDLGADKSITTGSLTISFNASGVLTVTKV